MKLDHDAEKDKDSAKMKSSDSKNEDLDQRVKQARAKLQEAFEQYSSAHKERSSSRGVGDLVSVFPCILYDLCTRCLGFCILCAALLGQQQPGIGHLVGKGAVHKLCYA